MTQNILVTGTNSGFGRLIARTLAAKGHQVYATMRDIDGRNADNAAQLEAEGKGKIRVHEMSLTDDRAVRDAMARILEIAGHIDVAVNNAGYSTLGLQETLTGDQVLEQYNVNVVGPHRVMRALLPSMRERGKGLIIQISSSLGRLVFPMMGAYCASKAALESLSEAYRYELKPTGVEVCMLQPGVFPTGIGERMVLGENQEHAQGYGPLANGLEMVNKNFEQLLSSDDVPHPQEIADTVLQLVDSPAGSRPARVVVDAFSGPMVEKLNESHEEAQKAALGYYNMGMLAD